MPWAVPEGLNAEAHILIWVDGPRRAAGTIKGGRTFLQAKDLVVQLPPFFQFIMKFHYIFHGKNTSFE